MAGWIDTSGELPSLKSGAVITGVTATIIYGAQQAFLRMFNAVTTGYLSFLDGIANFLRTSLPSFIEGGNDIVDVSVEAHAEWLSTLGVYGFIVVVVEAVLVFLIVIYTVRFLINYVLGAI